MGCKPDKVDKMKKFAVVFPGQGSQYVGMGKDFIGDVAGGADIIRIGERITGLPLMENIMSGPLIELTRTLICQPSIFGISMVCWQAFIKNSLLPCSVAGHSLGEYSALVASGVIGIEEGFHLIYKRAGIMDEISEKSDGGLLAVLGLHLQEVEELLKGFPEIEVSNINSLTQVVIGGRKTELERFNSFLKERKLKGIMLNVSGPFHTSMMKKASDVLEKEIDRITFKDPEIPVYLNYSGRRAIDSDEIKKGLVRQIYSPVRWVDTIENIYRDEKPEVFVEVGPKKVLKKLVEGIIPEMPVLNVEDSVSLAETLAVLKGDGNVSG